MKKFIKKIILAVGILMSCGVFAQSHDFSVNLAPMVLNNFSGSYFYSFSDEMSAGSVIGYQDLRIDDFNYTNMYVAPEFRFYFDTRDNDGYYAGAYMKFRSATSKNNYYINEDFEETEYDITNTGLAVGATFGRMWSTRSGFFFNPWSGFGFFLIDNVNYSNGYDPGEEDITNLSNVDFRVGLSIGWRFQ